MSGLVFVGGGTGSTFLAGAFITGVFATDFAVDFVETVLASGSFSFFVTLEAETALALAVGTGFVGDLDASVLPGAEFLTGAAMVLVGGCLLAGCLPAIDLFGCDLLASGAATDFGDFLSPFVPAEAFAGATLVAIAFGALVAFVFDELESWDFFDSTTEDLFIVALGLADVVLVAFATLAGIFAVSLAFLLGFAAGNLAAAFELADFLRAVGKVKLLAVWRKKQPQANGNSRSPDHLSMLAHVKISRVSLKTWIGQG